MTNVADLNIQTDILGVFDNTLNPLSKDRLTDLLSLPLQNAGEIAERQQVLGGFLANGKLLETYHYNRWDFRYVHALLTKPDGEKPNFRYRMALLLHKAERNAAQGIYIQLVLFLQRLQAHVASIDTYPFPVSYKREIEVLKEYLRSFDLDFFSTRVREHKFGISQVVALKKKIAELQKKETGGFFARLFTFEALLSISQSIRERGFVFPTVADGPFSISGVYHPLLADPVRNSVSLRGTVALITGPNMAGKSTFLKSVALCVYLGHLGLAVPAEEARFPFFRDIFAHFSHTDDLHRGRSHFMNEIKNLKKAVLSASRGTPVFAVFDEIFKGTNMGDALDITRATVQGLARFDGSMFFLSTHFDELKGMATEAFDPYFLSCTVESGVPTFSYRLEKGWSTVRIGRLLFQNEGLYDLLRPAKG